MGGQHFAGFTNQQQISLGTNQTGFPLGSALLSPYQFGFGANSPVSWPISLGVRALKYGPRRIHGSENGGWSRQIYRAYIYIYYIYRDRVDWPMDWEIDANKNHNCSIALCCFNESKIHDLSHPFTPKKIVDGANY